MRAINRWFEDAGFLEHVISHGLSAVYSAPDVQIVPMYLLSPNFRPDMEHIAQLIRESNAAFDRRDSN